MPRDIDEIRDKAREDAQRQKELEHSKDLYRNIQSVVSSQYRPPKGTDNEDEQKEYDRVYRDEKKRR